MGTRAVITHAVRTPIGRFLGAFRSLSAVDLGIACAQGLLETAGLDPEEVSEGIIGNARGAGLGPNPARQVVIGAGCPDAVVAMTVNQACASGLQAIGLAAMAVETGRAEIVLCGGTESMTNVPFFLPRMRHGYRLGHARVVDGMYRDGFDCPMAEMTMGETAEGLATEYGIGREEQDRYALRSQKRCGRARKEGRFEAEIVPVTVSTRKGEERVTEDEHPRPGTTMEKLGRLPTVFSDDGTIHAGNASGITDGSAMLLVMSEEAAEARGYEPLARCGAFRVAGVEPERMGIGPVPAVDKLLEATGLLLDDFDLIELNEAFAAQVLACLKERPMNEERLNVNGGAIALGHPIGATGARIVVTLLHELKRRQGKEGLATLCVSGGLGAAMRFSR